MNPGFWKDKKVLITGHTGFKGSWLSLWLQTLGASVTGFALAPPTNPNLFEAAGVAEGMASIIGDIRDFNCLKSTIFETKPEIVIHMAAQSLVRYSYSNPVETYDTNLMGTVHVLESIRQVGGVKAAVIVTTDKCYENQEWVWGYRENEPMGGFDPYSNSKGCAELATSSYRNSFFSADRYSEHGVAIATARAGNVIGGGDWALDRLIPDILAAVSSGKPVCIRNPRSIRPWQHVLEPLSGYLCLAEALAGENGVKYAEAWNFGPNGDDARPVEWIVAQLIDRWGGQAEWVLDGQLNPHEATYLKLDCSKAQSRLNWRPRWDLGIALDAIVDWHKSYSAGIDMRATTQAQITQFQTWTRK